MCIINIRVSFFADLRQLLARVLWVTILAQNSDIVDPRTKWTYSPQQLDVDVCYKGSLRIKCRQGRS